MKLRGIPRSLKKPPVSLRINFTWVFLSNIINGLAKWGVVISIAKFGTAELLGQFTLATGLVLPVYAFLNCHLRVVYITSPDKKYIFADFLGLRLITLVCSFLIICITSIMLGYDGQMLQVIMAYSLVRGAEALSDILFAPIQKGERMKIMSLSIIVRSVVSLIIAFFIIRASGNLVIAVLSMAAWEISIAVLFDFNAAQLYIEKTKEKVRFIFAGSILAISYPLGIAMGITLLNSSIPRFIVNYYLGVKEVGYFGAIQYFFIACGLVVIAVNSSSIPRLTKLFLSQEMGRFYSLLRKLFALGILYGASGILFFYFLGPVFLRVFYSAEYMVYSTELTWIVVAAALQNLVAIVASGILAMNRYWDMVVVLSIGSIIAIVAGIIFVQQFGMQGAVYAMVISSLSQLVVILVFLYHSCIVQKAESI